MIIWSREAIWLLLSVSLGILVGWLGLHSTGWGAALGLLAYLAWHARRAWRLEQWLQGNRQVKPPEGEDLWGEIFNHYERLKRRNRKRKRRLANIIKQFQQSTAAMPDASVVLAPSQKILWFNQAAQRLLGLRAQDIGHPITNLIRHPAFIDYLHQGEFEDAITMPSAYQPGLILSLLIIPYGEAQYLLIARDVSRLHQLERVRQDFVANASHELRTPLTVILGYLEPLLEDARDEQSDWCQPLDEIQTQARRMQRIIEDLLLLSRLEHSGARAPYTLVDIAAMLRRICQDLQIPSSARPVLHLEVDEDLRLLGTEVELYSIFSNLISNACKYTPPDGQVWVRWQADEQGPVFSVQDTGIGIAPEHIPRLTERFYRVDKARSRDSGGTGLGLAIVKHALERHGGVLQIESVLGQGSLFICHFPAERLPTKERLAAATLLS